MESTEYNQYSQQRRQLQDEVQSTAIKPMSFEYFEKSPAEKQQVKDLKKLYKSKRG